MERRRRTVVEFTPSLLPILPEPSPDKMAWSRRVKNASSCCTSILTCPLWLAADNGAEVIKDVPQFAATLTGDYERTRVVNRNKARVRAVRSDEVSMILMVRRNPYERKASAVEEQSYELQGLGVPGVSL
jgi:hypothetical protein